MADDAPADDLDPTDLDPTDLDAVSDELYGLHRDAFVPRRTELSKAARAAGDKEAATAIGALRKPSVAGWLANALARDHPDEVGALEDLGASLQGAQARLEGEALRALSRQRHELVAALVARARRIARDDGVTVGDTAFRELERTVTAALADPDAARAFAAGRLVSALEPGAGLGGDTVATPAPARRSPSPPARRPPPGREQQDRERRERDREQQEQERLERAVADARGALTRARAAADEAREADEEAGGAHTAASAIVADLRSRLADAEGDEARAGEAAARAREEHDRRRAELAGAERDLERRERERG